MCLRWVRLLWPYQSMKSHHYCGPIRYTAVVVAYPYDFTKFIYKAQISLFLDFVKNTILGREFHTSQWLPMRKIPWQ